VRGNGSLLVQTKSNNVFETDKVNYGYRQDSQLPLPPTSYLCMHASQQPLYTVFIGTTETGNGLGQSLGS